MGIKEEIKKIEKLLIEYFGDDSIFMFTFGSLTDEGRFNTSSDIDFAVYLKKLPKTFQVLNI